MNELNNFNLWNHKYHEHMITHEPNGPRYMDAPRIHTLINHKGSMTNNGPKYQCTSAIMNHESITKDP